jgi:hypothetical protein
MGIRYFVFFLLVMSAGCAVQAKQPNDTIETVFESFFGEPFQQALGHKEVQIVVDKLQADPSVIPLTLKFSVNAVEKVLLLKLKNTGYYPTGYFSQACADEPVLLASYILNPEKRILEIENRISTTCTQHTITLLLWVKTKDGRFYSNYVNFRTTSESPG